MVEVNADVGEGDVSGRYKWIEFKGGGGGNVNVVNEATDEETRSIPFSSPSLLLSSSLSIISFPFGNSFDLTKLIRVCSVRFDLIQFGFILPKSTKSESKRPMPPPRPLI